MASRRHHRKESFWVFWAGSAGKLRASWMDLSMAFLAHLKSSSFVGPIFTITLFIFWASPGVMFPASFSGIPLFLFLTFPVLPWSASGAAKSHVSPYPFFRIILSIALTFLCDLFRLVICAIFPPFPFCCVILVLCTISIFFPSLAVPSFSTRYVFIVLCFLAILFTSLVSLVLLAVWDMPIFAAIVIFLFPFTILLIFVFRITAIAISIFSFFRSI